MRALGDFVDRQRLAAEEFFEQFVVLLRGGFLQALVRLVKLFFQLRRYVRFGRGAQVQHLREARFLAERQLERDAVLPKHAANLLHAPEEVAVLLVELADENQPGFLHFVEHLPDAARPNLDAAHPVDHHNRRVRRADRRQRVAKEIGKPRRVQQGDPMALPLAVERLGVNGDLAFDLVGQTIRGAGPVGDPPWVFTAFEMNSTASINELLPLDAWPTTATVRIFVMSTDMWRISVNKLVSVVKLRLTRRGRGCLRLNPKPE